MPLSVLLILVGGGIAGIALALHLLGLSRLVPLDPDTVRAEWLRHFPDEHVRDLRITSTGHAALVETESGPGLLWRFGADTVARHLSGVRVTRTRHGITLRLRDYTAPRVHLRLAPDECESWIKRIETS